MIKSSKHLSKKFIKAQIASLSASLVDFTVTFLLTWLGGSYYVVSSIFGVCSGGIVNFIMGRHWVFDATGEAKQKQICRYIIIWISSMCLNTGGTIFFTEVFGLFYLASKVLTSLLVGIFFNYYFQKAFVFKTK